MVWLLLVLIVFILQMAAVLLLEFRNPSKTVAWMFILFCLPLLGFVIYFSLHRIIRSGLRFAKKVPGCFGR